MHPSFRLAGKISLLMLIGLVSWAVYAWNKFVTPDYPENGIGIIIFSIIGSVLILMFWLTVGALSVRSDRFQKWHVAIILFVYVSYYFFIFLRPGLIGVMFFVPPILGLAMAMIFFTRQSRNSRRELMEDWRSSRASAEASVTKSSRIDEQAHGAPNGRSMT